MGDVGSILLGFVFAAIAVLISRSAADFICIAGFLFPFYADELITMSIRLKNGENLLKPHRKHLYQILANELKIDHWKVSIGYGALQAAIGVLMLFARPFGLGALVFLLLMSGFGFIAVNYVIRNKTTWELERPF